MRAELERLRDQIDKRDQKEQAAQILPPTQEYRQWQNNTGANEDLEEQESAAVYAGASNPKILLNEEARGEYDKAMQADPEPDEFQKARSIRELTLEGQQDQEEEQPKLMQESELPKNEQWLDAARRLYETTNGKEWEGSDEDLSDAALSAVSAFNWNIPVTLASVVNAEKYGVEYATALSDLLDMYDQTETSGDSFWRAVGYMAIDPVTYTGLGAGKVAANGATKFFAKKFMQDFIKSAGTKRVLEVGAGLGVAGAIEGGTVAGGVEASRQSVEKDAGKREEMDLGRKAAIHRRDCARSERDRQRPWHGYLVDRPHARIQPVDPPIASRPGRTPKPLRWCSSSWGRLRCCYCRNQWRKRPPTP